MKLIRSLKKIDLLLWTVLFMCLSASFLFFYYGDLGNTLENSVLLVEALRDGEIITYYDYTIRNVTSHWAANYDLPIYVIFAIWNIPVIAARWLLGLSITSGWALLWCKGLIVVSMLGCVVVFYRICTVLEFKEENRLWGCFLFLSSLHVVAPAFILGQYDCIALFFILLGLYYYLKGSSKFFYVFFMIAVPLKMFALFIVVPLILLKEKRIYAAFLRTASTCILWLLVKLFSGMDSAYGIAVGAQNRDGMNKLLKESTGVAGQPICVFIGIWIAICIFCYMYKESEREKLLPVYVCFWTFASMMLFLAISDYWIVLLVPFLIFIFLHHTDNIKINILLETVGASCYLLFTFITKLYPYNYPDLTKKLLLPHFINTPNVENANYGSISGLLQAWGLDKFAYAFYTVFFICLICLVVINRPKKNTAVDTLNIGVQWQLMGVRLIAILMMVGCLLHANLSTGNYWAYSTTSYKYGNTGANLIDGHIIEQSFIIEEDRKLQELELYFINKDEKRDNMSSVYVEVLDDTKNVVLFSKRIGSNMIASERDYKIKLNHLAVEAGNRYCIRITGIEGVRDHQNYISVLQATDYEGDLESLSIDGEIQSFPLYFKIR